MTFFTHRFAGGSLRFLDVELERGVNLNTRTVVNPNTVIAAHTTVGPRSMLLPGRYLMGGHIQVRR